MSRLVGLVVIACLVAAGCGGGGGTKTNPAFVGRWMGTWTFTGAQGNQVGTADLTITPSGDLAGSMTNTTLGESGGFSGKIAASGSIEATAIYPGGSPISMTGALTIGVNRHLVGTLNQYQLGTFVGTVSIDLVKQ